MKKQDTTNGATAPPLGRGRRPRGQKKEKGNKINGEIL